MDGKVTKEQSSFRFYFLLTLLSAVIFIRYGLQINIPRELALVPIVAIAVLGTQTEIMAILMCLIPIHESHDFDIALILVIAVYLIKYYEKIKIGGSFFLMLLIMLWELLHCFTSSFSPMNLNVSLAPIIALTLIICSDFSELDYDFLVRAVAFAAVVTSLTMLIQIAWISRFNLVSFLMNLRRRGALSESSIDRLQISGGMVQTNSLGVICVIITAALLQLRSVKRGKKSDIFIMMSLIIFGTFTASRPYLVCHALMVFMMILCRKGIKTKLKFFCLAFIVLIFVVILFSIFFPEQLEYYISRFFVKDITTGRDDLMVAYNRFITKNPEVMFFGVGLQNFGDKLVNEYRVAANVPHNSIQEITVAWGIEGLILIAAMIFMLIHSAKKRNPNIKLINYIPLIILLFKSVAGQLLTSNYTMLALGFAYITMVQSLNEKDTLEENTK